VLVQGATLVLVVLYEEIVNGSTKLLLRELSRSFGFGLRSLGRGRLVLSAEAASHR
jgi:hypothetical protein